MPRSRWRAVLRWRDWSLPVKLGAGTLIPILIALAFGGVTLVEHIDRSGRYDRQERLTELGAASRTLLGALQRERTLTAAALTEGAGVDSAELKAARGRVDAARPRLTEAADRAARTGARVPAPRAELSERLGELTALRKRVSTGQVGAVKAVHAYGEMTRALLDLDTAVAARIRGDGLSATSGALHDILVARDGVATHKALIGYGIAFGLAPSDYNDIRTAEVRRADRMTEFTATATESQRRLFDDRVRGTRLDEYRRVVTGVLSGQDAGTEMLRSVTAQDWAEAADAVFTDLGKVATTLDSRLTESASARAEDAATRVLVLAIVLPAAVVLAAVLALVITRQLLRSLRILRHSALEVAEYDLPEALREVQEGRSTDTGIEPVGVHTRDEIGQVARAFDAVHEEALRLAAEQAGLRTGYAGMFVNLSRRSQSLVQRQLQLIERLERDEEDADQLATLFQLDHLATRMRRNNENLMVLSGAEPGRRSGQPVSATDVLRAAVSEIEQYQRVVVRASPAVSVRGHAAGDLIRLLAELFDNATAFSAPETKVTVAGHRTEDGTLSVEILDEGIGMNETEVEAANERLDEAASEDVTASRRMGLFVVGRLAARHGFDVVLHGGANITGVRATVTVGADAVVESGDVLQEEPGLPPAAGGFGPAEVTEAAEEWDEQPAGTQSAPAEARSPLLAEGGPLPRRKPGAERGTVNATSQDERQPSDGEFSGSALFTPTGRDEDRDQQSASEASDGVDPEPVWPSEPVERPSRRRITNGASPSSVDEEAAETMEIMPEWPSGDEENPAPGSLTADAGEPDEAEHARPGELSGRALFAANSTTVSQWWSAAVSEGSADSAESVDSAEDERSAQQIAFDNGETTPIFDEMVSAWFRKVTDVAGGAQPGRHWTFAADERWKTVHEVAQRSAPQDFTDAGLPRRRRGEQLLPGSAAPRPRETTASADGSGHAQDEGGEQRPADGTESRMVQRDPADVLGKLSSFQQGVHRGRRHRRVEADEERPSITGRDVEGPPRRWYPRAERPRAPDVAETAEIMPGGEYGNGAHHDGAHGNGVHRDSALGNGRHSSANSNNGHGNGNGADVAGGNGDADGISRRAGALFADTAADDAQDRAETPEVEQTAEVAAVHVTDGDTPDWNFGSDERWQAVREVSEAAPSSYTEAGLPRRHRGEKLLPGSVAPEESTQTRPRATRDPADVRGRLESFQQGVRRGRHAATAATDTDEEVEGE